MTGATPLRVGDLVVLDGDGVDDERVEDLVGLGFDFHEVTRVAGPLVGGVVRVRLDRGHGRPVRSLERELRRYRP